MWNSVFAPGMPDVVEARTVPCLPRMIFRRNELSRRLGCSKRGFQNQLTEQYRLCDIDFKFRGVSVGSG